MGIEDRNYYRDEEPSRSFMGFGSGGGGGYGGGGYGGDGGIRLSGGRRSVVIWLIGINVAIWIFAAFTPMDETDFHRIDYGREETKELKAIEKDGIIRKDGPGSEGWLYEKFGKKMDKNSDSKITQKEFNNVLGSRQLNSWMALKTNQQPWEVWRFLTHGFAHNSTTPFHLIGNMLALFFLGRAIEGKLGAKEFLRFYILALLFAGLVWFGINILRANNASAVGASGAVTAVVGLFIFCYPRQQVLLFFAIPVPAWALGVLILVMDIFNSISTKSSIAGEAHLAGFAFAAAYFYLGWNFHWIKLDFFQNLFKRQANLKVHDPDRPSAAAKKLSDQADEILRKVHEQGEESLTRKERKILMKHSRQVRKNKP